MLSETFGEVLYCPEEDGIKELPSPEKLMKRVIISTKPPKEYLEDKCPEDDQNNLSNRKDSDDSSWDDEPVNDTADILNNDKVYMTGVKDVFYFTYSYLDF